MRIQKCKGTRDLSPKEMTQFRLVEGIFRDSCLKWGYEEVRTPTIESLHLFTSAGTLTAGTLSKVYSFLDWDGWCGERVVLRPEGTIPAVRLYIDNLVDKKLARLFYIINTFTFEETGKENRERWQCGTELIGAGSKYADVELITLAIEVLKKLGLEDVELKLSHAGLIRALLAGFGLSPEEQGKVFDQILDGNTAVLARLKSQTPELMRLLTPLLDTKGKTPGFLRNLKAVFNQNLPEFKPALDNFLSIVDLLETMGQKYQIDIASGRGFEYYTGIIFQLFVGKTRVGQGGRYDALIPLMGGKDIPASGFALRLDRLMNIMKTPPQIKQEPEKILVRFVNDGVKTVREACEIAGCLRKAGFIVALELDNENKDDFQWLIEIKNASPQFVIANQSKKQKTTAKTVGEVLKILGAGK
ncbi:MAG: histidine--tRNA ligase family protein [Dehalococcoidales bacterium]|nr:histidine--tRNA ligase family protein [Dehalococcoidales bacterium]